MLGLGHSRLQLWCASVCGELDLVELQALLRWFARRLRQYQSNQLWDSWRSLFAATTGASGAAGTVNSAIPKPSSFALKEG